MRFSLNKALPKVLEFFRGRGKTRLHLLQATLTKDIEKILKIKNTQHAAFLSIFNTPNGLEGVFRLTKFHGPKRETWGDRLFRLTLDQKFSVIASEQENVSIISPEDPRIFHVHGTPYVYLNTWEGPWIYNFITKKEVKLSIKSFTPYPLDKNWTPFVDGAGLFFIHSFAPLVILQCDMETGICHLVQGERAQSAEGFMLRGGTTALKLGDGFAGFAHSNVRENGVVKHRPHLFVMKKDPFRIVFVGPPLGASDQSIQDPCNIFEHNGKYHLSMTVSHGEWSRVNKSIEMKIACLPGFERSVLRILKNHDQPVEDLDGQVTRCYEVAPRPAG